MDIPIKYFFCTIFFNFVYNQPAFGETRVSRISLTPCFKNVKSIIGVHSQN